MSIQIHTHEVHDSAWHSARDKLFELFEQDSSKSVLFLSSGGSAFNLIATHNAPEGINLTLGVLDERFSRDPKVNNFSQLMETQFYKSCIEQGYKVLDTRVTKDDSDEDFETFTKIFESGIVSWCNKNPTGVIIITQGMGPDGHTAGIFPEKNKQKFKEQFESPSKLVFGYDAGKENTPHPLRVTVTFSFLRFFVSHSVCLVVGESKENMVKEAFQNDDCNKIPFSIIRDMKDVHVYTDSNV